MSISVLTHGLRRFLGLMACVAGVWSSATPFELHAQEAPELAWQKDLVYARRGEIALALDFVRPAQAQRDLPCVVAIHGGGWTQGERSDLHPLLEQVAKRGYAAVSVSYRLAPAHRFPAAWEDVRDAQAYLVAHADELGIDPARMVAVGFSAGGHLALLLGLSEEAGAAAGRPPVRAVGNFFGPTLLNADDIPQRAKQLVREFIGEDPATKASLLAAASPLTHVSPGDARVRTFHGTLDPVVPFTQALLLHNALLKAGVPERLDPMVGRGHGWARELMSADVDALLDEWNQWIGGPEIELLLREDFEKALDGWWRSDPTAWAITGEAGSRVLEITSKRSQYAPQHRSPLHLAVRTELVLEDFVMDLDLKTTHPSYGHRDLVLVLGWQDPEHFYYVHLGQSADEASHGIFWVDGSDRRRLGGERGEGTPWQERWHRVRLMRTGDVIEVYFDDFDQPHLRSSHPAFRRGAVGFGSFDDTGCFDAVRIYRRASAEPKVEPSTKK